MDQSGLSSQSNSRLQRYTENLYNYAPGFLNVLSVRDLDSYSAFFQVVVIFFYDGFDPYRTMDAQLWGSLLDYFHFYRITEQSKFLWLLCL